MSVKTENGIANMNSLATVLRATPKVAGAIVRAANHGYEMIDQRAKDDSFEPGVDDAGEYPEMEKVLDAAIAHLSAQVSQSVNGVLNTPEFRSLQEPWLELERLCKNSKAKGVRVTILNQSLDEISADLELSGSNKLASQTAKTLLEGYLTPGAPAVSFVRVVDSLGLDNLLTAEWLAELGDYSHFTVFLQGRPELLGAPPGSTSFTEIADDPELLRQDGDGSRVTAWKRLRGKACSGRILMGSVRQLAYAPGKLIDGAAGVREEFAADWKNAPWISPAFLLLERTAESVTNCLMPTQIAGEDAGGAHDSAIVLDRNGSERQIAEIRVCDRMEKALTDLGFVVSQPYQGLGISTIQEARTAVLSTPGNTAAAMKTQLQAGALYRMVQDDVSKFIKRRLRRFINKPMTKQDIETKLEKALREMYCSAGSPSADEIACKPLMNVKVTAAVGGVGVYSAVATLTFHIFVREISVKTVLTTDNITAK